MINTTAVKKIKNEEKILCDLAYKIWANPETAYNEIKACEWTSNTLKDYGFEVETGYADMPTAIRAKWGSGKPVIGFVGEYDALPGLSQKVSSHRDPIIPGAPGHGCGHNLLGVACAGAAIGMKAEMEEKGLNGTIVFYGCPAEEVMTGKLFMARSGAFSDLDIAFAWHGSILNRVMSGTHSAMNSAVFHFKGRTAHAGTDPHNGRSALDAVELMCTGIQYLREHVTSDVRIHYIIKDGGVAPNIVPDKASVWFYVRAQERETVDDVYDRVLKCAEGAAIMTETEFEEELQGCCYNTMPNMYMCNLAQEVMQEISPPVYTKEEIKFANELNKCSENYEILKSTGVLEKGPLFIGVAPIERDMRYSSTDLGDVQHIVPGIMICTTTYNYAAPGHSWQRTACSGHSIGFKGMIYGAQVMAATAVKMLENPEHIEAAKKEFLINMKDQKYKCNLQPDMTVPQPKE